MEDKMNNRELTKKYAVLSYHTDVLEGAVREIERQIGKREIKIPIGSAEAIACKPSLTKEIDDLKETISMLFDYLDVEVKPELTHIIKRKRKTKNK